MSHPFIPVPNVASVELIYSFNGVTMENVFHVQKGSPYTLANLQALRATVNTWDSTTWAQSRHSSCTLQRIRTKALDTNTSPIEDFFLPTPRPGTQPGTALPGNATWCMKLGTGLSGRSFRGRWYLVGLCTGFLGANGNLMNAVAGGNILGWLNALPTALLAAGHTLGVVSYRTANVYRITGLFTAATGFVAVDFNLDSMRRRLTGRGI